MPQTMLLDSGWEREKNEDISLLTPLFSPALPNYLTVLARVSINNARHVGLGRWWGIWVFTGSALTL